MADAGKIIPLSVRMEIRERRQQEEPIRKIAEDLRLSKTTVQKYGRNRGTNLLENREESA